MTRKLEKSSSLPKMSYQPANFKYKENSPANLLKGLKEQSTLKFKWFFYRL